MTFDAVGSRFVPLARLSVVTLFGVCLAVSGCIRRGAPAGPFPGFADFAGDEVVERTFSGDVIFPRDSLRAVVRTRPSRCRLFFLPICIPGTNIGRDEYRLDLQELARDVARLQLYHRDHGYYNARIEPRVEPAGSNEVAVDFTIAAGRPVVLRDLSIEGVDPIVPEEDLLAAVPLEIGEPFGRVDFYASADTIRLRLLERGHAYADVLRNYALDTIAGVAEAQFVAIPGPVVVIDTILFQGNERLSERTLRRHIAVSEGEVLRDLDLDRTQRNLYDLGMVSFASVGIAPDTLQVSEELDEATVLVQVVEAAQFAVDASAGFGSVECFRAGGSWINRNFLGGARRLEAFATVSRVGVGRPVDFGLERSICSALGEENFIGLEGFDVADRIDYTIGADFQQPSIFGTRNQLAVNVHSERISEPEAYIRESTGGRVAAVRELDRWTVISTTANVQRGRTIASPAILCVGFDTCTQDDLELLSQTRWSNTLSLSTVRDRTRTDGVATRGYLARGSVDWSSPAFGSNDEYLRVAVDASRYWSVRPGWVLAGNIRAGRFLRGVLGPDAGYIPPEQRFYAGGPNSVRGYARNALGPTSYVIPLVEGEFGDTIDAPTGGTQLVVGSLELRMPSPWMSDVTRLALFVDAGHVSNPGVELASDVGVRFTPGAGLRFLTPVGPFRIDVAYNPYAPVIGPLYLADPRSGLILLDSRYQPEQEGFLGRFRVQVALGQAF